MKFQPKIGTVGKLQFTVAVEHGISFADDLLPNVLSTPTLIWFLENSAREALAEALEDDESCVGAHVDVQHLAPTPMGHEVNCTARLIHAEDRQFTFQVEAHDESQLIARGVHKRQVIDKQRFARLVAKKAK